MFTFVSATRLQKVRIAKANKLFIDHPNYDGGLRHTYNNPHLIAHIEILQCAGVYIGVGLINRHKKIQIFVKAKYRRKGLGSTILNKLKSKKVTGACGCGIRGSYKFWEVHGISYPPFSKR